MARTISRPGRISDGQSRLPLVGAIGLAILSGVFALVALRGMGGDGDGVASADLVEVVVAAQRIEAGTQITDDALTTKKLAEDAVIENAVLTREGVTGLVARHTLEKGEQFTTSKIGLLDESGGPLGRVVPAGKRSITVAVTEEKVFGGLLAPGDRVDVIAIVSRTQGDEEISLAIALVQNAEVLAVADEQLRPIAALNADGSSIATDRSEGVLGEAPDDPDANPEARNVSLAVTPEEALRISLAQEEASVWLSLRGPGDNEIRDIPAQLLPTQ